MLALLLRHPVRLILGAAALLFVLYEISVGFFAYTGDAYVTSDIVIVSSEIEGPVSKLAVEDNATVKAGELLFEIEPTPYRLAVDEADAALVQTKANVELAGDEVASAKAGLVSAQAVEANASTSMDRVRSLSKDGFSSEATLDVATRDLATASANVLVAQSALQVASRRVAVSTASVAASAATLAKAKYEFSKTAVTAPEAGRVAPFTTRQGDYVRAGTQVMAIVTDTRRRIVANIAERHLSHMKLGQKAWVTLGAQPWVIHGGRVSGISAGVARSPDSPRIVPYVEPTTDWVRLPRRFPVEITLDEWEGTPHFVGSDARVLIWF
ncbi:MAG: HlyD family efflux transporter periplasmic adaptor subunit [Xanthobacteraceae bacterium]|jgi:multidrug efflux system membrane fusion protein|nr:HlyD family efflux transporter periplasmic adaptor subunit [Xanthobacteraceae bacterium]